MFGETVGTSVRVSYDDDCRCPFLVVLLIFLKHQGCSQTRKLTPQFSPNKMKKGIDQAHCSSGALGDVLLTIVVGGLSAPVAAPGRPGISWAFHDISGNRIMARFSTCVTVSHVPWYKGYTF